MDEAIIYTIRLKGYLDPKWSDWFGGMEIHHEANGETRLEGAVVDQAALHGILAKVRDLGLPLLTVTRSERPVSDRDEAETIGE